MALEQGDPLNEKVHYNFWPKKMKKRHTYLPLTIAFLKTKQLPVYLKMKRVEPSYSVIGHEKKL